MMEAHPYRLLESKDGKFFVLYDNGAWSEVIDGMDELGYRHYLLKEKLGKSDNA